MAELALKRDGSLRLMGHVIADFPSRTAVRSMVRVMADAGVKVIEVQIPFSEPMADGPLFLAANHAALAQGTGYAASLELMRELSAAHPSVHFVFMTYLNIVFKRGYAEFIGDSVAHGAVGAIIPDLPLEYAGPFEAAARPKSFANIRLIAPNASDERLAFLLKDATGLVYAVARAGVTGAQSSFTDTAKFVQRIRRHTELPVAVGFGVRTQDHVRGLKGICDLAIVGTAALECWQAQGLTGFTRFWQGLAAAAA